MSISLYKSYKSKHLRLRNKIVMAPLTRSRADKNGVLPDFAATYYKQRASAGLIITEATNISPTAIGYAYTPGIYSRKHVAAWKKVTEAVHANHGKIFMQLWHVGRYSHPSLMPHNILPVAPSHILAEGSIKTYDGIKPTVVPKALLKEEIKDIVFDYQRAAVKAMGAGMDGVEIHGANGYLIDQFLHKSSNKRRDLYGGSVENRSRFLFEVIESILSKLKSSQVGIRLSPSGIRLGMDDPNPIELFSYVINKLNDYDFAYLHLIEPSFAPLGPQHTNYLKDVYPYFRKIYQGTLIANGGFSKEDGEMIVKSKKADLVAYGKLFISNPDLVERFKYNAYLNPWDDSTFYTQGEDGYIDYPMLLSSKRI